MAGAEEFNDNLSKEEEQLIDPYEILGLSTERSLQISFTFHNGRLNLNMSAGDDEIVYSEPFVVNGLTLRLYHRFLANSEDSVSLAIRHGRGAMVPIAIFDTGSVSFGIEAVDDQIEGSVAINASFSLQEVYGHLGTTPVAYPEDHRARELTLLFTENTRSHEVFAFYDTAFMGLAKILDRNYEAVFVGTFKLKPVYDGYTPDVIKGIAEASSQYAAVRIENTVVKVSLSALVEFKTNIGVMISQGIFSDQDYVEVDLSASGFLPETLLQFETFIRTGRLNFDLPSLRRLLRFVDYLGSGTLMAIVKAEINYIRRR